MNAKKCFVAGIVLNTLLVGFAGSFYLAWQKEPGAKDTVALALTGPSGKFGPVIETVLPAAQTETADILDLETGRVLHQPAFEAFNSSASAIMNWIRSNGLDISCFVWSGGAACVTYDMAIVPVEGKCWKETTEEELADDPALAPGHHSPRRLLLLGPNRPNTYIFRTAEGTLGMLRIVGLSNDGRGVKIRYRLIGHA